MLSADNYNIVYIILITLLTIWYLNVNKIIKFNSLEDSYVRDNSELSVLLLIIIVLFIGLRPVSVKFADMTGYLGYYYRYASGSFVWNSDTTVPVFDNFIPFLATISINYKFFFILISAIYFGFIFIALRKFFPNSVTIAFLVYLAAFSTFSYATNGMRAGMASALFLVALAYHERKILSLVFVLLSVGMHQSMWAVAGCYIVALLYKRNLKIYYVLWVVCLFIALLHITYFQNFFASSVDEHNASYLTVDATSSEWREVIRFRFDLVIYSVAPIVLSYYMIFMKGYESKTYFILSNTYILANCFWLLCMYAAFTNRIAYLSWFLYPVVLIYPFFDTEFFHNQYSIIRKVIFSHLLFTLFMEVIYYA